MARHPHADLMIKYANNSSLKIQWKDPYHREWKDIEHPTWSHSIEYRIKPEPLKVYVFIRENKDTGEITSLSTLNKQRAIDDQDWFKRNDWLVSDIEELIIKGEIK